MDNAEIIQAYVSEREWTDPVAARAIRGRISETVSEMDAVAIVEWMDGADARRGITACRDGWWLLFAWEEDGPLCTLWLGPLTHVTVEESRRFSARTITDDGEAYPASWGPVEKLELRHEHFPGGKLVVDLENHPPDAREEIRERLLHASGSGFLSWRRHQMV
jgi:hypothetical protein